MLLPTLDEDDSEFPESWARGEMFDTPELVDLMVFGDSEIVIKQVINTIHCLSTHPKHYQSLVQDLISQFLAFNISPIPRS